VDALPLLQIKTGTNRPEEVFQEVRKRLDWELFLGSEKEFWARDRERVCSEWWLDIKKNRTSRLKEWLSHWMQLGDKSTILQIGPGAEGMINFLQVGQRFAIDPLADFFKSEFSQILDPSVTFTSGVGEELPYEDDTFDLVIIYNALDHTFDPQKVLSEIHRVLKHEGINHLAVHTYPSIWLPFLKLLGSIQREKEHPWRYTSGTIKRDVLANSFRILDVKHGGEDERSIPNWLSLSLQLRIARLVGLCAPMTHVLARKDQGRPQEIG